MPKKKDQVFYQLTVTEKQLRLINTALEEYFRIGMIKALVSLRIC